MAKKRVRKTKRKKGAQEIVRSTKRKISLVLKNLILFAVLFILSLVLYSASSNELYTNLFQILAMIFGFVILAFLIVLLVFIFMRVLKK